MSKLIVANSDAAKVIARGGECLRLLLEAGLSVDDLQAPNDDADFRQRLVRFWGCRGVGFTIKVNETKSQQVARDIMGTNFLGLSEVVQHFGALNEEQTAALAEVSFSEETLRACSDTHVLVADIGLSILDLRQKARKRLFYSHDDSWYNSDEFAPETEKTVCWRLIRKTPVENSTNKMWEEQKKLIPETDEVPSARQAVYMIILHFLATGERLFETLFVRTSSVSSYGYRLGVGSFGGGGLSVDYYDDSGRSDDLGVSSSRKS